MLVKKHKKHNTIHIGRTKIKFNNEDFASLAKTKVSMEPKGETGQPSANKSRRFMEQKLVFTEPVLEGGRVAADRFLNRFRRKLVVGGRT